MGVAGYYRVSVARDGMKAPQLYDDEIKQLQDLAKNDALDGSGYDGDDIDVLIAQLETELQGGNTDPDEVPGAPDDASWIWGSITSSLVRIITKSSRI